MRRILSTSTALMSSLCLALGMGQSVWAQDEASDDVIVVTSGPLGLRVDELVGSNDVVSQEHLEDNLAGSLADTLSHEPGVSTTYFGPAASRPVIRGLGSDRVRVLVNGVGLIDASTASPDHAVASEALEAQRVEILRGPAAIAYGGGAIGGVINVIDGRIPEAEAVNGFEGRFYGGVTSVDEGETAAARVRFNLGGFVVHFEGLTRNAGDYEIPGASESEIFHLHEVAEDDDHEEEEASTGFVENSGLQFDTASGGISLVGDWGYVGLGVKQTDALYGVPGHHPHGDDEFHEGEEEDVSVRIAMEQTRYDFRGEWNLSDGFIERIKVSIGTGEYQHRELEGTEIGTVFDNSGWEGRFEARFKPLTVWGGDWESAGGIQAFERDFVATGEEAFVPPSITSDWGAFFVERWDRGPWGLEGGLRLESRDLSTAITSRSFETTSLSGSVFIRPQDDTFLALTLSSSERAPTDVELFADGPHVATSSYERGDANIDVERALSLELTARTQIGDWEIESAIFRADYDGFIGSFPTGLSMDGLPLFQYRQSDVVLSGIEGRARGPLARVGRWDIEGEVTAEYVSSDLESGGSLPRMPPLALSGRVEMASDRHTLYAEIEWADVQNETAELEFKTPGYALLGAGWTLQPFDTRDIRIILQARNLLDIDARHHTSPLKETVPLPGRNLRAALVLGF